MIYNLVLAIITYEQCFWKEEFLKIAVKTISALGEIHSSKVVHKEMATYDNLTGLPNRKLFQDRLAHTLGAVKRHKLILAVLFIELDGFKKINDTLGHGSGDIVLKTVGQRIKSCVREYDTVSKLGGDEFTIIIERLMEIWKINEICKKINDKISKHIELGLTQGYVLQV